MTLFSYIDLILKDMNDVGRIQDLRDDDIGREETVDVLPQIAFTGQTVNKYALLTKHRVAHIVVLEQERLVLSTLETETTTMSVWEEVKTSSSLDPCLACLKDRSKTRVLLLRPNYHLLKESTSRT